MSTSKASGGGVTIQYPMLDGDNYGVWAAKMKIFMRARGVWAAVEGEGAVEETKDQEAFARSEERRVGKECSEPV